MSLFDKIKDATYVIGFKQFLHRGSNESICCEYREINSLHSTRMCSAYTVSGTDCACRLRFLTISRFRFCLISCLFAVLIFAQVFFGNSIVSLFLFRFCLSPCTV